MVNNPDPVRGREILLSIDPAQSIDFSAVTLVRLESVGHAGAIGRILGCGRQQRVTYDLQSAQIVRAVKALYDRGARGVVVVIDAGGVGRGLMDMVRAADPLTASTVGISLHGGAKSFMDREHGIVRAAKLSVVSHLDASFAGKRLIYSSDTPGISILQSEISNLRATTTSSGNTLIAAGKANDDVVFSLAQGWYAVSSPEIGPPMWSAANASYFERLAEAKAPIEDVFLSEVDALEENDDMLLPPVKAPYRFRIGR